MADMYYGKGLSSKDNYEDIQAACKWPETPSPACDKLLGEQSRQVGPHNIYNIYDNCQAAKDFVATTGLTMYQVQQALHTELDTGVSATATLGAALGPGHPHAELLASAGPTGGYPWACGGNAAVKAWLTSAPAMKALHIEQPGRSNFSYYSSGPASITLHPELSKKVRMLIYNGDADACVPYV